MDVGIGLPATIPGADGALLVEWGRRAEERGFSSVAMIDRLVYDNYEPLVTLAAVAGATSRIRLTTSILIAPYHANTALLAKQAASLDRLSAGRLALGMALGTREDDFEASGIPFSGRGRRFDAKLAEMRRIWDGETDVGPRPFSPGGPEVLIGGISDQAFTRAAKHGSGWISGSVPPKVASEWIEKAKDAWAREGREGAPRILGFAYYSLGPTAREDARRSLTDYYAFVGVDEEWADSTALTDTAAIREAVDGFAEVGCDELIMYPCAARLDQVDLLADAVRQD